MYYCRPTGLHSLHIFQYLGEGSICLLLNQHLKAIFMCCYVRRRWWQETVQALALTSRWTFSRVCCLIICKSKMRPWNLNIGEWLLLVLESCLCCCLDVFAYGCLWVRGDHIGLVMIAFCISLLWLVFEAKFFLSTSLSFSLILCP